jgi:hypothetical protein
MVDHSLLRLLHSSSKTKVMPSVSLLLMIPQEEPWH